MLEKSLTHASLQVAGRDHSAPSSDQAIPGVSAIVAKMLLIYPCGKSVKATTHCLKHKLVCVNRAPQVQGIL